MGSWSHIQKHKPKPAALRWDWSPDPPGVLALPCLPRRPCHFGDGVPLEEAWSSLAWHTPVIALPPCSSLLPFAQRVSGAVGPLLEPRLLP